MTRLNNAPPALYQRKQTTIREKDDRDEYGMPQQVKTEF